jgi:hypothetical protein
MWAKTAAIPELQLGERKKNRFSPLISRIARIGKRICSFFGLTLEGVCEMDYGVNFGLSILIYENYEMQEAMDEAADEGRSALVRMHGLRGIGVKRAGRPARRGCLFASGF